MVLALQLAAALAFVVIEMTLTWLLARRLRNFGVVDIVWSAGFGPLALVYWIFNSHRLAAQTTPVRWEVMAIMVLIWSLRLAVHLLVRVAKHHPVEDVRYAKLREEWGAQASAKMFWFFQLQGGLQVVLSVPWLLVFRDGAPGPAMHGLGCSGAAGLVVWVAGLLGESISDRQLAAFRANPANKGQVCRTGLWNYSRHPNYFFEWLIWVGYAIFALGSPMGWIGILAPALMLHFLVNVTGVPMTEELSVKSKGDAYREYQRTTSAFVPWFRKR